MKPYPQRNRAQRLNSVNIWLVRILGFGVMLGLVAFWLYGTLHRLGL
jgi:hypothetical protein